LKTYFLHLLTQNHSGVLIRVAGLFSRRGYNILSLNATQTNYPDTARITIEVEADDNTIEQIKHQLAKLVDVKSVDIL
jgi:acetolactate synthase-1/3 small subunit